MRIVSLDHLVLTVASIERCCAFYVGILGMRHETFGEGRNAIVFGSQKINLHLAGNEFEPKAVHPTPGSGDLCFVVDDVAAAQAHLEASGIEIIDGPVARTGAIRSLMSVYCRDPDGNLVELAEYQ